MCNFGGCAGYSGGIPTKYNETPEEVKAKYNAMMANAPWMNSPLTDLARNMHKDTRPIAERKGWLTQKEIDKPEIKEKRVNILQEIHWFNNYISNVRAYFNEPSEKKSWIESIPGGWSTLIVLICFIAGMWGLWLIWQLVGGK